MILKKGTVIDSLSIPDFDNKYSIYLPKDFDKQKTWPILMGFNSQKNTVETTKLFQEAAEEHGYILAVTDFENNKNIKDQVKYVSSFMKHMISLFPVQQGRICIFGNDIDSRLVSLIPALYSDQIFGVIAIGDSYFYNQSIKIKRNFSYIGVVSTDNYRYKDFFKNKQYLKSKAVPADIFVQEGETQFPNKRLLNKALSQFTMQSMLKGRIPKDSIWVRSMFDRDLKQVDEYLKNGQYLFAYNEVKRIRISYSMFFDTKFLKDKQKEIRKMPSYKREKRIWLKYSNQESALRNTYLFSLEEDINTVSFENLGWWQYQVSELDTLLKNNQKSARHAAKRVKDYLRYIVDEYKNVLLDNPKALEVNMLLNILSTIIDKDDFDSYKRIISLSAQDRDFKTALFYLEELLKKGYKDLDALYAIDGTLTLRISKEYNKVIQDYLGTSKFFSKK
ncbi:hypothetical protein [Aquimarina algicola]|uniref:Alpha/beta hydrolase n=1 Tax=Aquimarina algicola TaxID=2589995 RepID=A0A504J810_9FLAO|nr:hypothetical protein [Aquimarina algicola]TPN84662.1 hypothetical protein FHK87_17185 [Aquimarina algicola]